MRRILRIVGAGALVVFLFLSVVWANLAIAYQLPGSAAVRIGACLVLNLIALAALVAIVRRKHWRAVLVYAAAYALLLAWSGSISASNDKNWAVDVVHGITGIVVGTGFLLAMFAISVGAPKQNTPRLGRSGPTIFLNSAHSIYSLFIGWDRLLLTRS